jgi:hypothetical protein
LSYAQEGLWHLDRLMHGNISTIMRFALALTGHLEVSPLRATLTELTQRHEILRTNFIEQDGAGVQVVAPWSMFDLTVIDLEDDPGASPHDTMARIARVASTLRFDLARDPLFQAVLFRLDPRTHLLLLTMHHMVCDEWSLGVLFNEMTTLYEAFANGRRPVLPPLPIQYADFAVHQRRWVREGLLAHQRTYWERRLQSPLAPLTYPAASSPSASPNLAYAQEVLSLSGLESDLSLLSRAHGVTTFMTLLAAFKALLHLWTGQTDIRVGTLSANRTRAETESLIGFFTNTLVLRTHLAGDPSFVELLLWVRAVALDAYAHQDFPFEVLLNGLPAPAAAQSPLLQVMFIAEDRPPKSCRIGDLIVTPLSNNAERGQSETTLSTFDLIVSIQEGTNGLNVILQYSTVLFDPRTMRQMLRQFERCLAAIVENPGRRLSSLPVRRESR